MRSLIAALILMTAAPGLGAQQRIEPPLQGAAEPPKLEFAVPVEARSASPQVDLHSSAEAPAEPAASAAILDEAFWRHILAGVIITVVSTLILRAIL